MMRIVTCLLFVSVFCLHAEYTRSQNARVSLNHKQILLEAVLNDIEAQTDYLFIYNKYVDVNRKVSIRVKEKPVSEVLSRLFAKTNVEYVLEGTHIVLSQKEPEATGAPQQERPVTGKITDSLGEPVIGASVVVKGSTNMGTITNVDGMFTLNNLAEGTTLVISYLGYATQEVRIGAQRTLNITLSEESQLINEVVVTALGIRREQKAVGYATQTLKGSDIVQANTSNIGSALSGKVAGVLINNANQLDGGSTRIVIRGNNNIQGNNQPLIIVDGMPLENNINTNLSGTSESVSRVRDFGSGLNFINSNDIEDMNVLKGPAAAALYGARGANGVILITTKKGAKKEGIGIDYSYTAKIISPYLYRDQQNEYGYGGPHLPMYTADTKYKQDAEGNYLYPAMTWGDPRWDAIYGRMPSGHNTYDDAAFTWHAYSTSWGPRFNGENIKWWDGQMRPYVGNPDAQKYYYHNGYSNTHNVSFSGGGEFGAIRVGITREDNQAVIDNSNYGRTAISLGSDLKISNTLKAEVYATYSNYNRHNVQEVGDSDNMTKFFYLFPTDYRPDLVRSMYKNADGSRYDFGNTFGSGNSIMWDLYENSFDYDRDQLLGSIRLVYNPLEWLTVSARTGLDFHLDDYVFTRKPTDISGLQGGNYAHRLTKEVVQNSDFMVSAQKDDLFWDKFNAGFTLGATRWDRRFYQMTGVVYGDFHSPGSGTFKDPYLYTFGNYDISKQGDKVNTSQIPVEDFLNKRINSLYGFLDLSYGDFIYLQVTGRNDWSSTLPAGNNSYFYPSSSLSFVPTALFDMPSWFNFAKVRLAYASAASDTDPYQVTPTFQSSSYAGAPSATLKNTLPPTDLKPQRSTSYEAGFNAVMFDNRFNFDLTYYHTRSFNQIMEAPIASSSGYDRMRFNTGEMENRGIEIITGYDVVRNRDFDFNLSLNLARNRNKLLSMGEGAQVFETGQIFGGSGPRILVEVGDSYGNIYGWDYARNADGEKIIDVVYDLSDNTKVAGTKYRTTANQVKLGNITPDLTGGLMANLRWKNFRLYALADFSWGSQMWSGTYATSLSSGLSPSTLTERNGGGLPYTYPDGTTANHGIKMDGMLEIKDGEGKVTGYEANNHVVHYVWKYGRLGAWGSQNLTVPSVLENNWIKMREITVSYDLPVELVKKTGIFQSLGLSVTGRDLFYFYSSLPDNLNPEALSNSAGNAQGLEFGALPGMRSFNISIKAGF
ncbi:MAG: SusC/RagA family TonB-linked outer membrane protein [Tannerellaceae bacterium]|nr:SusC/RagA family TonB-linked outer membrane protein [Tannerellaceae bacterium]